MIAKKESDIQNLRTGGKILSEVLRELADKAKAGVTTAALDLAAEQLIRRAGAVPAFLNYKPQGASYPFPAALCASINDEVVHGIPSEERVLEAGDIVTLDLGLSFGGMFVDSAVSVCVGGGGDAGAQKLLTATREALTVGIAATQAGGHVGDIGAAVAAVAKKYGLSVVAELGGHALGKKPHEQPFIANIGRVGEGEKIVEGMVLALEPIFTEGKGTIDLASDQWTYVTRDGSRAAHFEQTILVTKDGAEIVTPF
ncbi:MAG: type I methionyl aminopeptidase [bacterium]